MPTTTPGPVRLHLGPLVRAARFVSGLTQTEFVDRIADSTGRLTENWLANVEDGVRDPNPQSAVSLIGALDLDRAAVIEAAEPLALLPVLWGPELGKLIRDSREQRGWSSWELAAHAAVSDSTVTRWELATCRPRYDQLGRVIAVLGLDPKQMLADGTWPPVHPARPRSPFADLLYRARKQSGLSQRQFAERLGLNQNAYATYEIGRSIPERSRVEQLADRLGMTFDELWRLRPVREVPDVDNLPPLARLLVTARMSRNLHAEDVAAAVGVSIAPLRDWEMGNSVMRQLANLIAVVDAVGADRLEAALAWLGPEQTSGFGGMLRLYRVAAGLEPRQLADMVGVHRNRISAWECGTCIPPADRLPALAIALGVPVATLARERASATIRRFDALGAMLRSARVRRRLSWDDVAATAGVRRPSVAAWERGVSRPDRDRHPVLAEFLGLDVADLEALAA